VNGAAARNFPPGDLRVSDADRDQVVSELGQAFQDGRITAEELDERSGLALRARTGNDLAVLLADLPPGQAPGTGVDPVPGGSPPLAPRRAPWGIAGVALAVVAVIAVASLLSNVNGRHGGWIGLVPILIVVLVARRIAAGGRWGRRF
jgi:hypothetical protein